MENYYHGLNRKSNFQILKLQVLNLFESNEKVFLNYFILVNSNSLANSEIIVSVIATRNYIFLSK